MPVSFTGRLFGAILLAALALSSPQAQRKPDEPGTRSRTAAPATDSGKVGGGENMRAKTPLGTKVANIARMEGSILVSIESGLAAAWKGMPLGQGVRVIAMRLSEAIVKYDDGCEVHVKAGERLTVDDEEEDCDKRIALVQSPIWNIPLPIATGSLAIAAALPSGIGAGLAGAIAIATVRHDENVSPN